MDSVRCVALAEHSLGHALPSENARRILVERYADSYAYQISEVYAWCGDADNAFRWLDRAYLQHDAGLAHVKYDPLLESVRSDSRYKTLLQKLNLPI